jgi:hypothetical protein
MNKTLYFVEHTDSRLSNYYLFTDEGEPFLHDSFLCFMLDRKTLDLSDHDGQSRVFVNKRYVKRLINMDNFPVEEMFGDDRLRKSFEESMKLIYNNI